MKLIKRLAVVLVVLVVLLIVGVFAAVYFYINPIVKKAVNDGGTYALGVPTTLDSVNVGLLSGDLSLKGFTVGSPAGFSDPHFLKLDSGDVAVSLASLRGDVITVPKFALDGIDVYLEKKDGKANYEIIIDNAQKATGGGSGGEKPAPQPQPSGGGAEKKLIINDLLIRNVTVHAQLLEGVDATKVVVPVKEIHLTNVGQTGEGVAGSGVTVSQLSAILVEVILAAAVENGGGLLPKDMLGDLQGQLGNLSALKNLGVTAISGLSDKALGGVQKQVDAATKKVEGQVKDAADKVGDKIKEGLGGLIPGQKKEDDKKKEEEKKK